MIKLYTLFKNKHGDPHKKKKNETKTKTKIHVNLFAINSRSLNKLYRFTYIDGKWRRCRWFVQTKLMMSLSDFTCVVGRAESADVRAISRKQRRSV